MHITAFEFQSPLSPEAIQRLLDLIPDSAIQLWGDLEPLYPPGYIKTGITLELVRDEPPKVEFFSSERRDQPYDANVQAFKFATGSVYDRIHFREAGLNRLREYSVTIAGLKSCIVHWLSAGYGGNLDFLISNTILPGFVNTTCLRISVYYGSRYLNKEFQKQGVYLTAEADIADWTVEELAMLARFEDQARLLGFLTEFPQPVLAIS
ncbi:MAG TPA: hypothetical protein VLE93_01790 [Candidatus Saccharimonadales bacterium]|nr:hypothetical protein [Candidatus Saccharimonadales bacterium]